MSELNKKVVQQFVEGMGTNNTAMAAECLADDAYADAKGYGKLSGKRPAKVMVDMLDDFKNILPSGLRFTIANIFGEGDWVAVEAVGDAVTADGKSYRNNYAFLFRLEDGKIKVMNEYFCNVHANEVLWPLVEASGIGA